MKVHTNSAEKIQQLDITQQKSGTMNKNKVNSFANALLEQDSADSKQLNLLFIPTWQKQVGRIFVDIFEFWAVQKDGRM